MTGYMYVYGPCVNCHQPFSYNADWVPSVVVEGQHEPICRGCVEAANPQRIARGLDPIQIHPQAYEPMEDFG